MIGGFFRWWGQELAAMLPARWTRSSGARGRVLEIEITAGRIAYRHRAGGDPEPLGELERPQKAGEKRPAGAPNPARDALHAVLRGLDPRRTRCRVSAADGLYLKKRIGLPLAAEENLRQVLAFEMERHTPFHAEDVYFDFRVVDRDAKSRRLEVELLVMQKSMVDEALAVLGDWKLRPATASLDAAGPSLLFVPDDYRAPSASGINRLLLAANVGAMVIALLIPIQRQETYLTDLRQRVDAARERAMSSLALKQEMDATRGRLASLLRSRSENGSVVEHIEELTRVLPDDTWLNRLEIRDGELHFQGFSGSASALVGVVEASELFRDARFGSPITRDARSGRERFHVSAKLSPRQRELARARPGGDGEG